jgi:anti-anti-sigma regulatory factor
VVAPSSDETERLLAFLYQLPVAVVQTRCDGTIELINPAAAALLNRFAEFAAAENLLTFLDSFDPEIRRLVTSFSGARGVIFEERLVLTAATKKDTTPQRPALALTASLAGADQVMVTIKDETSKICAEVELERRRMAMRSMAAPLIEGWEGTLLLPVVGIVDEERAATMTADLLDAVVRIQARYVIVDFTGVVDVTVELAGHLERVSRAIAMMGCRCILSGVSPQLARLLTSSQGLQLSGVEHVLSVRAALSRVVSAPSRRRRP